MKVLARVHLDGPYFKILENYMETVLNLFIFNKKTVHAKYLEEILKITGYT